MQLTEKRTTIEEEIRSLVAEARRYSPGHLRRQQCLTQIIRLIEQSQKLWHENTPFYEDAKQQMWVYFCQNICEAGTGEQYDPNRSSVITWLNRYLKWRLQDFRIAKQAQQTKFVSSPVSGSMTRVRDLTDNLPSGPDVPPILEDTRTWVELDMTGELRSTHIQNRPEVNCQALILRRLPPETSWEDLSIEFGVAVSTLSSFYQRKCISYLRNFGQCQGYL
jgi:hypothetical protein